MALLTVRSAAERLGVGYSTLKRWVHTGHVRTTRTEGGHHRIAEAEIERLLARQSAGAEAPPRGRRSTTSRSAASARATGCAVTWRKCASTACWRRSG